MLLVNSTGNMNKGKKKRLFCDLGHLLITLCFVFRSEKVKVLTPDSFSSGFEGACWVLAVPFSLKPVPPIVV